MEESFEDKMVEQIRKGLKSYHTEYEPDAWEQLKKGLPQNPLPRWINWKSILTAFGGMLIIALIVSKAYLSTQNQEYKIQDSQETILSEEKNFELNTEKGNNPYLNTENPPGIIEEPPPPQKMETVVNRKKGEEVIVESTQTKRKSDLFLLQPIPATISRGFVEFEKIHLYESPEKKLAATPNSNRKFKLKLPKIKLSTNSNKYSHFVGPNKLSIYYSPEYHLEKTLRDPGFGNGVGLEFEGPLSPSLSLAFGIEYHSQSYSSTKITELDSFRTMELNVEFLADSICMLSGNYSFIEVPATLKMKLFANQRTSLFLEGGFSMYAFLNQQYNSDITIDTIEINNEIKKGAWKNIHPLGSVNLGLAYRYSFSGRISINGSLIYKKHLSKTGALPMELDRFSFKAGIVYRFGRKEE